MILRKKNWIDPNWFSLEERKKISSLNLILVICCWWCGLDFKETHKLPPVCLCGRFRNVFQIQPNCIWNPPCFIYSSSFPSVWPCFISLSSLFCQWIHFLFYLLFLVCVFVCLCVWPWLTGHCCSALQPIPLGPCLCCLFSDLDSLSLSLWVALLPLSPPPSFSLASLMLFFFFFVLFPLSPFPFPLISSLFMLLSWSFLFAPCSATLTAFFHPSS